MSARPRRDSAVTGKDTEREREREGGGEKDRERERNSKECHWKEGRPNKN